MPPNQQPPGLLIDLPSTNTEQGLDVDLFPSLSEVSLLQTSEKVDFLWMLDEPTGNEKKTKQKGEKRKQQIREASRRCRMKQKDEVTYLRSRVTELEQILRDTTKSTRSNDSQNEIFNLRFENERLNHSVNEMTKQLDVIHSLVRNTLKIPHVESTQHTETQQSISNDHVIAMKSLASVAVSTLMNFSVQIGTQIMTIHAMEWAGDVWLDGTLLRFKMKKSFVGSCIESMAERAWRVTNAMNFANNLFTLVSQECVTTINDHLRIIRRLESVMEMRLLEHFSLVYREDLNPNSIIIGTHSIPSQSAMKYTHGNEAWGLILTKHEQIHVEFCGTYNFEGVPESEISSRISRHTLQILLQLECLLMGTTT